MDYAAVTPADRALLEAWLSGLAGARLGSPRRPDGWLSGVAAARELLATWLGPGPPTEGLKRALLGLA